MAGKFVLKKGPTGKHRKAGNGEIIATSGLYTSKALAKNGRRVGP
jgi:uncharacterized protein YegP (UPF0339 family)